MWGSMFSAQFEARARNSISGERLCVQFERLWPPLIEIKSNQQAHAQQLHVCVSLAHSTLTDLSPEETSGRLSISLMFCLKDGRNNLVWKLQRNRYLGQGLVTFLSLRVWQTPVWLEYRYMKAPPPPRDDEHLCSTVGSEIFSIDQG